MFWVIWSNQYSVINRLIHFIPFRIFAGTVVMVNYLLMMTWLPASVSLNERLSCYALKWWLHALTKINSTANMLGVYMQNKIIYLIMKMPFLWFLLFGNWIFEFDCAFSILILWILHRIDWDCKWNNCVLLAGIPFAQFTELSTVQ